MIKVCYWSGIFRHAWSGVNSWSKLHPILAKIGQPKCGVHTFRRFRNTYLKNRTSCPEGVRQFHCNCLILGEVARPERFELPAFWFVGRPAKTSKCRY